MKILLLEDNETLNETIKLKLELKGYEVFLYDDGIKAYEDITDGFSCFILDINVPNINGIKILERIREFYEDIPVIIISASIEVELIKNAYELGCNDYLKKPFYIDELEIKVDKVCNISKNDIKFDENCIFSFKKTMIKVQEKEIILSEKENLLMNLLLKNKNELVTYENIQNYVWKGEYTSLDAIRTLVRRLRKKISSENIYIKASSNRGYIFKTN